MTYTNNVGFDNTFLVAANANFTGTATGGDPANDPNIGLKLNDQVWMGRTALNVGGSNVNVTTLTAGAGISFLYTAGTPNTFQISAAGATTDLHTARYIVSAGGMADGANYTDIATAYAAAVVAGAPQTVFIQPGTYTENLTLTSGINLSAYNCDAEDLGSNVIIAGKLTATFTGACAISGIEFRTNADFALSITGANATVVRCFNCFAYALNNNALELTSSNAGSKLEFYWSQGDLAATFAYFTHSGAGKLGVFNSVMGNNGASTAASTSSGSGTVQILNSYFANAITTSGTSNLEIGHVDIHGAIIAGGTGAAQAITNSSLDGGTASSLSIGAGVTVSVVNCTISSTNTNAITGVGTLQDGGLQFSNTSSLINTTTQVPLVSSNDAIKVKTPGAYPYTTVPQDAIILVDTSAARSIVPLASPTTGQKHIIKDSVGSAAANNITITPSGKNIDGAASATINIAYGSATIVYNGTEWSIV